MAKSTYAEIQKQIAALQAQAETIKQDEVAGVVAKIREAIEIYGLTPEDLFGRRAGAKKVRATAAGKTRAAGTQYSDGAGNVWGGRGPRPQWLRDALTSGKQLSDFAVGGAASSSKAAKAPSAKRTGAKKAASKKSAGTIRFRDDQGNAWSGFGPKPGWLKAAIAAGKSADDFRA